MKYQRVTLQMKVPLGAVPSCGIVHNAARGSSKPVNQTLCVTIHTKATGQYINLLQFITLYKVGKILHSLDHNDE